MRFERSIKALSALGLIWVVQLASFAVIFALTLILLRQIGHVAGIRHLPALVLSCALTFLMLAALQKTAWRRGWFGRSPTFSPD